MDTLEPMSPAPLQKRGACASWAIDSHSLFDGRVRIPKRLILVRHGESQGNVDSQIYESAADNILHLTERGWQQAICAGCALKEIVGDDNVKFAVSPYVRTRETFNAIAKAWGGPSNVKWSEDPRLREQDFGNFQDARQVKKAKKERSDFGPFYYRMPSGESPADVYDRVSSFFETMHRSWSSTPSHILDNLNYILIIHGVTIAVFLMRLFKYSVDEYHKYENFDNAEFCVLERARDKFHRETTYCMRQVCQDDGRWVSERGPQRKRPDAGRFDRAINYEPPSVLLAAHKDSGAGEVTSNTGTYITKDFQPDAALGFRCDDSLRVESVAENSQADVLGVMPNWQLVEVNSKIVEEGGAPTAVQAARDEGKSYPILFCIPES